MRIAQLEEALAPLRAAHSAEDDAAEDRARRAEALRSAEVREAELGREIEALTLALQSDQEALRRAHAEAASRATPDGFSRRHFFVLCLGVSPLFGLAMLAADVEPIAAPCVSAVVIVIGLIGWSGWSGEGL